MLNLKKQLANIITCIRIIGTLCLIFIKPLGLSFFIVYTLSGLSDVFDGMVARRCGTSSQFGARLDSIADIVFYSVMLIKVFPIMLKQLPKEIWIFVLIVLSVRLLAYLTAAIKFQAFASLHTYLNKVTGFAIFLIPYFLNQAFTNTYCLIACIIAALSSLEELMIHILNKNGKKRIKTIFMLLNPKN